MRLLCQEEPPVKPRAQDPKWLPATFAEVRYPTESSVLEFMVFIARKTKCDGAHPACSSCARRSLPCNYNHDSSNNGANKKGSRRASLSSKVPPSVVPSSVHTQSPPSSTVVGDVRYQNGTPLEDIPGESMDVDLKRKIDDIEPSQIQKRMRVDESTGHIIP